MHPNAEVITKLYTAFQRLDAATMATCYHHDVVFNDEAFRNLNYLQTTSMWAMLCERAKEFSLTFSNVEANDTSGKVHWEANYLFSQTGRTVHNVIEAEFEFKDGKIYRHRDTFNFYRWSRMALGPVGIVLGWSSFLQNKVSTQAMAGLEQYMKKKSV